MNRKTGSQLGASVAVLIALVLVGTLLKGEYLLHLFILIMMNIVLASSLRLINLSGQLSLAHGGMVTLGAYTSALLVMKLDLSSWLGLLTAGVVAAIVSCLIGIPFTRLKGIYFTMVSIFFVQIVILSIQQWRSLTGGASGLFGIPRPDGFLGIVFKTKSSFFFLILAIAVVSLLVMWAIEHSRVGMTFRGIQQADSLAESVGINTTRYKVLAFTAGGFFAGLIGAFYAHYISSLDPTAFSFLFTLHIYLHDRGRGGELSRAHYRRGLPHIGARGSPASQVVHAPAVRRDTHGNHLLHARRARGIAEKAEQASRPPAGRAGAPTRSKGGRDLMLQVDRLTKNFGGLAAVNTVDMAVQRGELVGLIGPNGAGKTTFFNLVTGYLRPSSGTVPLKARTSPESGLTPWRREA